MPTKRIPVTDGQAHLLASLQRQVQIAEREMTLVFTAIVHGHDLADAEFVGLEPGVLVVTVA